MADVLVPTNSPKLTLHPVTHQSIGVLARWVLVLAIAMLSFLAVASAGAGFIPGLVVGLMVVIVGTHPAPPRGDLL